MHIFFYLLAHLTVDVKLCQDPSFSRMMLSLMPDLPCSVYQLEVAVAK